MAELDAEAARDAAEKLKDPMFTVRRDACKALVKAGRLAEPYLQQLKEVSEKDEDHEVKKAAKNAIRELIQQGVELKKEEPPVDPKQQQIDEQNQVWATRAGKQLHDKSWNVRKDACKRLGTVGRAAEPHLQKLRELLEDEKPEVRKAADAALKKLKEGGIFLPEPEIVEQPPPPPPPAPPAVAPQRPPAAADEDDDEPYVGGPPVFDFAAAARQGVWRDAAPQGPQPIPAGEADVGPEWWESLPGGPSWNPDEVPGYESMLLEEQARERVIPKEQKVELDQNAMMREAAETAAEEIQDVSNVIRKDACKTFGGLGKFAKPYLELIKGTAEKDPAPDVRLAAKAALKELREDGVAGAAVPGAAAKAAPKPEAKVTVLPPSPSWTGPIAHFRIFDEVVPMLLDSDCMTPNDVVKVWESWGIKGAGRARFQLQQPGGGDDQAEQTWMNPREDVVPLAPAVVRLEAKVGSVLSSLAVALKGRIGQEDAYREERLNRRRDPRSKLWIEGPPMLKRSAPKQDSKKAEKAAEPKEID